MYFSFVWFVYVAMCPPPRPYATYISYAYGTIQPICAESAAKHQANKQTLTFWYQLAMTDLAFLSQPSFRWTWVSRYQNVSVRDVIAAKDVAKVVVTAGAIRRAMLRSNCHTTNKPTSGLSYSPDALAVLEPTVSEH